MNPDSAATARRRPTVLVLDDDPASLRVVYFSLRQSFEVFACETLLQAVAIAREERIDIFICDFFLRCGQTGPSALARLREEPAFRPHECLLITSNTDFRVREEALSAGFDRVFVKPLTRAFRAYFEPAGQLREEPPGEGILPEASGKQVPGA